MKRKAQSSITYLLLFAVSILFVLTVFRIYKNTPKTAAKTISAATKNYSTTMTSIINSKS